MRTFIFTKAISIRKNAWMMIGYIIVQNPHREDLFSSQRIAEYSYDIIICNNIAIPSENTVVNIFYTIPLTLLPFLSLPQSYLGYLSNVKAMSG